MTADLRTLDAHQSPTSAGGPPIPDPELATVAVAAPGDGPGYWAGAPSAVYAEGVYYLAYRLRRPVGSGRGYANVIARSDDGLRFEPICTLDRDDFDADSLERPALVAVPGGGWRIYVSCATPGTAHWRVDLLEADDPSGFTASRRRTVLPGNEAIAVKDPVIRYDGSSWHLWASCHPLDVPTETDRMVSDYATSVDGVDWTWHGTALRGRRQTWDSRGTRIASVLVDGAAVIAYYDGRASAGENWEERTGIAVGVGYDAFTGIGETATAVSPYGSGCLRYVDVVDLPGGARRLYFEASRPDGAHDLMTQHFPPGR